LTTVQAEALELDLDIDHFYGGIFTHAGYLFVSENTLLDGFCRYGWDIAPAALVGGLVVYGDAANTMIRGKIVSNKARRSDHNSLARSSACNSRRGPTLARAGWH
jgi:hypothetical protein